MWCKGKKSATRPPSLQEGELETHRETKHQKLRENKQEERMRTFRDRPGTLCLVSGSKDCVVQEAMAQAAAQESCGIH